MVRVIAVQVGADLAGGNFLMEILEGKFPALFA
jgi:hypothetical protein